MNHDCDHQHLRRGWRPALGISPGRTPAICILCEWQWIDLGPTALVVTDDGTLHSLCDRCFERAAPEVYSELVCDRIMAATDPEEWMNSKGVARV